MLVSSEVHVGVTGRGAIGPRLVYFDDLSALFQMYLLYRSFLLNISIGEVDNELNYIQP
jgi:hypothetical protein